MDVATTLLLLPFIPTGKRGCMSLCQALPESKRGICRVDEDGRCNGLVVNFASKPSRRRAAKHFPWVDPLGRALDGKTLLSYASPIELSDGDTDKADGSD